MRFEFTKSDVDILVDLLTLADNTAKSKDRPRRLEARYVQQRIERAKFREKIAKYAYEGWDE